MRFHKLKLNNFRQFIGEHVIHFAGVDDEKKVTLIWGANGYGKTGIFRGIMFCLYGDRFLEQDSLPESDKKEGLLLVNEKLLEEKIGERVTAFVELTFDHNGSVFELKRTISAIMSDKDQTPIQEPGEIVLKEVNPHGNAQPPLRDLDKIEENIAQLLNRRVRDYFLFDGERMEKLTRYGTEQRREIQRGIKSLLQVDALEVAIQGLKKQERELTQKIRSSASGELEIVSEQLQRINEEIQFHEDDLRTCEDELIRMDQREKEIEQELEKIKGLEDKQERRKDLRSELATIKSEMVRNQQEIQEFLEISGGHNEGFLISEKRYSEGLDRFITPYYGQ